MATVQELQRVTEASSSRYAQVGSLRMHYNDAGTGDPPLLCIHGGGPGATGWSNFRGNLQDLAQERRMVMVDMPGYGGTDFVGPSGEEGSLTFGARLLRDLLDVLRIPVVDIIGNSMGGQAGLKFCIDYPERARHLVVIGSQPTQAISIQSLPLDGLRVLGEYYQGDGPSVEKMKAVIKGLVYDPSRYLDEATLKERYEASIKPNSLARAKAPRRLQDLYFELANNKVPTLIAWGQDDKAGALEVGLLMLRRFQNARMHIFQRCGHWAQVEHRAEFDRVVMDFLKNG